MAGLALALCAARHATVRRVARYGPDGGSVAPIGRLLAG